MAATKHKTNNRKRSDRGLVKPASRVRVAFASGSGEYTYLTEGINLKIGDIVEVPGNFVNPHPRKAEVTGLGSDYDGPCKSIIRKV